MPYDTSIVHAWATPIEELSPKWSFAFTTGYGAWALAIGSLGKNRLVQKVPWRVVLEIRYGPGHSFFHHEQIGDHHLAPGLSDAPFRHGRDLGLFVWTKTQSLYLSDLSGSAKLMKFSWEKPLTHLCSYNALVASGYYDEAQLAFLGSPFDPDEWAGKGCIVDDQAFFDAWVPSSKMRVYQGYWKYFMNRFSLFIKQRGLMLICHPKITEQTRFSIEGNISSGSRRQLVERMPLFFSSELQVGIYGRVSRAAVDEFHKNLPDRIRVWIERRRA